MTPAARNGLSFFQFEGLCAAGGLDHGIFTRAGGVSRGPFESLNLAAGVGDDDAAVRINRDRVAACFHGRRLSLVRQVHGTGIRIVAGAAAGAGNDPAPPEADALVTDAAGVWLAVLVADCQPVLIADPERGVVAAVHSGWRGSIANIIGRTVSVMTTRYGCRPEGMLAGIGPSLGPCCAEFIHYRTEIPRPFWGYRDHRSHFDFWAVSRDQLLDAGLRSDRIEESRICTRCRPDRFFSYRHTRTTGRFAAVIGRVPGPDKGPS